MSDLAVAESPYPTFGDLIEQHQVEGDSAATTKAICEWLELTGVQIAVLWSPLLWAVAQRLRQQTRKVERDHMPRNLSVVKRERTGQPVTMTFAQELLSKSFALDNSGKRQITWGAATVDHHRERVRMLQQLRSSVQVTIAQHEEAIALIQSAGVSCLNEIGPKGKKS